MKTTEVREHKPNIAQYLDTVGDGTGVIEAIADYSGSPEEFFIKPPTGKVYELNRMIFTLEDSGSIDSGGYGNQSSALTNGISIECRIQGETVRVLTAQVEIKRTADWKGLCFDGEIANFGSGNQFFVARWTFTKDGDPILLRDNDTFVVKLNDDFTHLVGQRFLVKGRDVTA